MVHDRPHRSLCFYLKDEKIKTVRENTQRPVCTLCGLKLSSQWTVKYFSEFRSGQSQNTLAVYTAIWPAIHTHMKIHTQTHTIHSNKKQKKYLGQKSQIPEKFWWRTTFSPLLVELKSSIGKLPFQQSCQFCL